jgi:signal transduction histidine kinase
MPKLFWKSLRSRILLLAVLTFLFLAGAAFSFFTFLRSSHSATLSVAERHLVAVASALARSYADRSPGMPDLRSVRAVPFPNDLAHDLPRLPPGEPSGREQTDIPAPPPPPPRHHPIGNDALSQLTARALRQEPGIEGGFFAAGSHALVGYAFPTHEGPGPNKEMPQRERPTIERLVQDAVLSDSTKTSRFEGPHDAVLFVAVPIKEAPVSAAHDGSSTVEVTGAVWLMQRMPGVTVGRNRQLLWGSVGFGIAALITALLTFFVTTEVSSGVKSVLARLGSLENGLFAERAALAGGPQLEEFDRVLDGIDALATSLQQKIESERTLEAQMRHKERLSALGQFAAGIAHELRNPLATIRLRTQMSERSSDLEGVGRNSSVILEEVDRLDTIIGRLLYFSRPIHLQLQPVSLDELCSSTRDVWTERESSKGVDISCVGSSGMTVVCDRSRMLQVLDNLMENAVYSASTRTGGGGRVSVTTARQGSLAHIEIRDNGSGLDADALSHALDPFFTTKATGTGLGLSISFEIVQAHGGEMQLSNHPEGGAVACVCLPITSPMVAGAWNGEMEAEHEHG